MTRSSASSKRRCFPTSSRISDVRQIFRFPPALGMVTSLSKHRILDFGGQNCWEAGEGRLNSPNSIGKLVNVVERRYRR